MIQWCLLSTNKMIQSKNTEGYKMKNQARLQEIITTIVLSSVVPISL